MIWSHLTLYKLSFGTIHWNKKYKINFHTFWSYISYESSWPPFSFLQNWSSNTCPKKINNNNNRKKEKKKKLVIYNNPIPKPSLRASILSMVILSNGSHNNIYHKIGKCKRRKPNMASTFISFKAHLPPLCPGMCVHGLGPDGGTDPPAGTDATNHFSRPIALRHAKASLLQLLRSSNLRKLGK